MKNRSATDGTENLKDASKSAVKPLLTSVSPQGPVKPFLTNVNPQRPPPPSLLKSKAKGIQSKATKFPAEAPVRPNRSSRERDREREMEMEREREREREKEKEKEKEKEQRRSARVGDKGGVDDVQVTDNSGVECPTCHKVFKNLKALGGHTKGQWESF